MDHGHFFKHIGQKGEDILVNIFLPHDMSVVIGKNVLNAKIANSSKYVTSHNMFVLLGTLNQRCIKSNSTICVILRDANIGRRGYQMWDETKRPEQGAEYIMCETSRGELYKVQVNLEKDTPQVTSK